MAVEIRKSIDEALCKLPPVHPDRRVLENLKEEFGRLLEARETGIIMTLTEFDLKTEWSRQAKLLITLGFHKQLRLSEKEYLSSLPLFEPQPESFKGKFDIPVLVEPRIPVAQLCKLATIMYPRSDFSFNDWHQHPDGEWCEPVGGYTTPNNAYVTWMQDGSHRDVEKLTIRRHLAPNEKEATFHEGLALYIAHPEILLRYGVVMHGSFVEIESNARYSNGMFGEHPLCLVLGDNRSAKFNYFSMPLPNDNHIPDIRPLTCGRL